VDHLYDFVSPSRQGAKNQKENPEKVNKHCKIGEYPVQHRVRGPGARVRSSRTILVIGCWRAPRATANYLELRQPNIVYGRPPRGHLGLRMSPGSRAEGMPLGCPQVPRILPPHRVCLSFVRLLRKLHTSFSAHRALPHVAQVSAPARKAS